MAVEENAAWEAVAAATTAAGPGADGAIGSVGGGAHPHSRPFLYSGGGPGGGVQRASCLTAWEWLGQRARVAQEAMLLLKALLLGAEGIREYRGGGRCRRCRGYGGRGGREEQAGGMGGEGGGAGDGGREGRAVFLPPLLPRRSWLPPSFPHPPRLLSTHLSPPPPLTGSSALSDLTSDAEAHSLVQRATSALAEAPDLLRCQQLAGGMQPLGWGGQPGRMHPVGAPPGDRLGSTRQPTQQQYHWPHLQLAPWAQRLTVTTSATPQQQQQQGGGGGGGAAGGCGVDAIVQLNGSIARRVQHRIMQQQQQQLQQQQDEEMQ